MFLYGSINVRLLGDSATGKTTLLKHFTSRNPSVDGVGISHAPDGTRTLLMKDNTTHHTDKHSLTAYNHAESQHNSVTDSSPVEQVINIWDTPKHLERWDDSETTLPPRDLDAILILYDVTNPLSFKNIQSKWIPWIIQTREEDDINDCCRKDLVVFLVGNKCDCSRHSSLTPDIVQSYVEELNEIQEFGFVGFMETCSVYDARTSIQNQLSSITTLSQSRYKIIKNALNDDSVLALFRAVAEAVYEQRKKAERERIANTVTHSTSSLLYSGEFVDGDQDETRASFSASYSFWNNIWQTFSQHCVILNC